MRASSSTGSVRVRTLVRWRSSTVSRGATVLAATDAKVPVIGIRMFRTSLRDLSDLAEQLLITLAGELRAARMMEEPS
jgi:hypothetical protein